MNLEQSACLLRSVLGLCLTIARIVRVNVCIQVGVFHANNKRPPLVTKAIIRKFLVHYHIPFNVATPSNHLPMGQGALWFNQSLVLGDLDLT